MPAYAIAQLEELHVGPDIVAYLQAIDATLAPFDGRFLVHGSAVEVLEGPWSGDIVVVEFPSRAQAAAWHASPAYQEILPLRTRNSHGRVVLVDGAGDGHRAVDLLAKLHARATRCGAGSMARPTRRLGVRRQRYRPRSRISRVYSR